MENRTAAGQIPESWVGQAVKVRYGDGRGSVDCTLQPVADKGITLDVGGKIRFLPWNAVLHIEQRKPSEQQEPEIGPTGHAVLRKSPPRL